MKLVSVIQSIFNLFNECMPLYDTKIDQVGSYISFQGMRTLDAHHRQLDFTIYVAGYSFSENASNALVTCDSFLEKIEANKINPVSLKSLIESKSLRLASIKDGLYVYAIEFSLRIEL